MDNSYSAIEKRIEAACAAAQAGCGMGEDVAELDEAAKAGWRKQALLWLRAEREAWAKWIAHHRPEFQAIGLPAEVYLSRSHWGDFLENGYLEWHPHDRTGFVFDQLSPASAGALRRFLENQYADAVRCPPLLGWLRVRHQEGRIE